VASLLLQSLRDEGILKEDDDGNPICGGKFTGFADNCGGQNKNNTVIRLAAYLVESGYFKEVEIVFLIVGHTKNACDRLFNSLKVIYRKRNVWSFTELASILDESWQVKVHQVKHTDFFDWTKHHNIYYNKIWDHNNDKAAINNNHIFHVDLSCISIDMSGKKHVVMKIRAADVPEATTIEVELKKNGAQNLVLPTLTRPQVLQKPGRNPKKITEFFTKWKEYIPHPCWPEMCPKPTQDQTAAAKNCKAKEKTPASKRGKKRLLDALEVTAMGRQKKSDVLSDNEDINLATLKRQMEKAKASSNREDSDDEDIVLAELARNKSAKRNTSSSDKDSDNEDIVLADLAR
jgi:hypothetical protein